MAYQILPQNGDSLRVPQLVLNNLNNGRDDYFRVALYLLSTGDTEPGSIAAALNLKSETAAVKALAFWQGAGLLKEESLLRTQNSELKKHTPRLTTREVLMHSGQNPEIAVLMQEAQQVFGEVISENACNTLASLYINDKMPLDYILMGLAHFAAQGITSKKIGTIQRRMESWQEQGIATTHELEEYLQLIEQRQKNQEEVAQLMRCSVASLNLSELTKINIWYEQYRYTEPMISMAIETAGEGEKKTIAYINGILKKWNGKGYRQPRDVLADQQGNNAMPTGRTVAMQQDLLQKKRGFVPKFKLEED